MPLAFINAAAFAAVAAAVVECAEGEGEDTSEEAEPPSLLLMRLLGTVGLSADPPKALALFGVLNEPLLGALARERATPRGAAGESCCAPAVAWLLPLPRPAAAKVEQGETGMATDAVSLKRRAAVAADTPPPFSRLTI